MMKRVIAALTLLAVLLTGCALPNNVTNDQTINTVQTQTNTDSTTITQPEDDAKAEMIARFELNETFQNLLNAVNAEHEAVKMYDGDYEAYAVQYEGTDLAPSEYAASNFNPDNYLDTDARLTMDQIREDMEICYQELRTGYGAYAYFGGDEAFRAAIDAVIADCAAMEVVTYADLRDALVHRFSFVEDGHFSFDGRRMDQYSAKHTTPFFFRDTTYRKTERGYETLDGRVVASVDGYEDWENLFRLSLTTEGDLVYYPIILEDMTYKALRAGEVQCPTPVLTVRYTDGSWEELHAEPYTMPDIDKEAEDDSIREENGIPVVTVKHILDKANGSKLLEYAEDYQAEDIVIVDLRRNNGGIETAVREWARAHAQQNMWGHALRISLGFPDSVYVHNKGKQEFVSMDKVSIVLTSKFTVSAGEHFVDMAHNMENTLVVGENTRGWLCSTAGSIVLPNTTILMTFGESVYLYPDSSQFEEYRGFYPDIWVPAAEAEEAVMNFIAKNTTVTYEQTEK